MKKKPLHLKTIDPSERTFFHFKLDASTYVLYDSDLGEPVSYGSFNIVGSTISNLNPKSTIFYFEMDSLLGWKMKRTYKPKKEKSSIQENKESIQSKKDESKPFG